jgi:hypothetical protein
MEKCVLGTSFIVVPMEGGLGFSPSLHFSSSCCCGLGRGIRAALRSASWDSWYFGIALTPESFARLTGSAASRRLASRRGP